MLTLSALHTLLDLTLGDRPPATRLQVAEWNLVLDVAELAAVAPQVDAMVLKLACAEPGVPVPVEVVARARMRAADTAATASAWRADLLAAAVALEGVGVVPIALKGAALVAHAVFPPGGRHMHEVDRLSPAVRATDAFSAMLEHGFTEPEADELTGVDGQPRAATRWRDPHIAFHVVGPYGTHVEVHSIASRISGGSYQELAPLCVPTSVEEVSVLVPAVHRLRRMLNEHVFVSHLSDPRLLLRHVADLAALERWAGDRVPYRPTQASSADRISEQMLMRLARARAGEASLVTSAQRLLLARDGGHSAQVEQIWHFLEALEVSWYDLRYRPALLARRVVPHPAYLAALYQIPLEQAGSLSTYMRRWRELRSGLGGSRRRQ